MTVEHKAGSEPVQQPWGEPELSAVLTDFARTMVTDFPIEAILDRLVERIVDILAITAAGVTLIEPGASPRYVAASNESALRYEKLQTELGEGPCLLAYTSGDSVHIPDLREENRFVKFAPRALAAGMRAVFTFPLRHGDRQLGALDLYRDTPGVLSDESLTIAQTLADVVASYLLNAQAREDLQDSSDRSKQASLHDALTGLPNRVLLLERLGHAFLRSRRTQRATAVYFIDLDLFKAVNDTHGHGVGDELLMAVGIRLGGLLRPPDTIARLAGDEFVAVCEDLDSPAHAGAIGERMTAALRQPFELSTGDVTISASIGIAYSATGEHDPEHLLHDADMAMYQAKHKGGARQQLFDPLEQQHADRRAGLARDLHHALERDELHLDYQPIVDTADGRITGFEALLRWTHPQRDAIPPSTLIPLAEQTHLITDIGTWVLNRAWTDRERWSNVSTDKLTMAVNVSAHQLMAPGFAAEVATALHRVDIAPELLTLEITESAFVQDSARALLVLQDLKALGVMLALDDFGTGYSSLIYLQRFPIDIIKIDRSFTAELGRNASTHTIVEAVVDLSHKLGLRVVAQGVETTSQHHLLAELGCDSCQGFYFARPIPGPDVKDLLSHGVGRRRKQPPFRTNFKRAGIDIRPVDSPINSQDMTSGDSRQVALIPRSDAIAVASKSAVGRRDIELDVAVGERDEDGVVVINLTGPLDRSTCDRFWAVLDQLFGGPASRVVVDAAGVTNLDRAGVQVLLDVAERAAEWDTPFAVSGLMRQFPALIRRSGIECLGHSSVALAVQEVRGRYLPGEATRVDMLREISRLHATVAASPDPRGSR